MKKYLFLLVLIVSQVANSQCVTCYTIEEAMLAPQRVKELILVNQGYNEIPEEIDQMTNLEYLNLSQNQIKSIDSALNNCLLLKELDLSRNVNLSTVSAAKSFFDLPYLEELDISHNASLYLNSNIGNLKSLRTLKVSNNKLMNLPQTLSGLSNLIYLDVSNNELIDSKVAFSELWKLEYLDISGNFDDHQNQTFESLRYKDNLKVLRCSLSEINKEKSICLNSTGIENLVIVGSTLENVHSIISKNKTLIKVSFENSILTKPNGVYRRLNSIRTMNEFSFEQTAIDPRIEDVTRIEKLNIINSDAPAEVIAKNKSITSVVWVAQDENVEPMLGIVADQNSKIEVSSGELEISSDMKNNNVTPISTNEPSIQRIKQAKDTILKFQDTECIIQKETFLDNEGKVYLGEIEVQVTEYFDPIINAISGAPMVAEKGNGENGIFASNGMIEFFAFDDNGEELNINPEKPVEIAIRDVQPNVQSDLYEFIVDERRWAKIGQPQSVNFDSIQRAVLDSLREIDDREFSNIIDIQPYVYLGVKKSRRDPYEFHIATKRVRGYQRRITKRNNNLYFKEKRDDIRLISYHTWYLDTTVSEEMDSVFKYFRAQLRNSRSGGRYAFRSAPRLIRDVAITSNLNSDNYTLTFSFKGDSYSYPVYAKMKSKLSKEMIAQKRLHKKYVSKYSNHLRNIERIEKLRAEELKQMANQHRLESARLITNTRLGIVNGDPSLNSVLSQRDPRVLRFVISGGGLFNCDWFALPPKKVKYEQIPDTIVDRDGETIQVPEMVRYVLLENNSYFEISRLNVPEINRRKSVVIMTLSAIEIAVITSWKFINDRFVPVVKRINIEGKNAAQIREEILN